MTDTSTALPATFLVPVGHDLGPRHRDPDRGLSQVRVGTRIVDLDQLGFAIWLLAHDRSHAADGPPGRTDVVDAAVRLGLEPARADGALAELLDNGLLVELGSDPASARHFAESHQLEPLMVGLGPDSADPGVRVVGLLDVPVVQMSMAMYDLWMWAHLQPNLWLACLDAADTARDAGLTAPDEVEPERVLAGVLSVVHPLLAARAAYFDPRHVPASGRTVAA